MLGLMQLKHSQEFAFSKNGSETAFVSSSWAKFNMIVSTSQIQASKIVGSFQLSQHFICIRCPLN